MTKDLAPHLARLFAATLPVRSISVALPELARFWQAITDRTAIAVCVGEERTAREWGLAGAPSAPVLLRLTTALEETDRALAGADPRWKSSGHSTPQLLTWEGQILGTLRLFEPAPSSEELVSWGLWLEVSARLLATYREASDQGLRLEADKLSALAEFAGGAGHEINNPLGTILGRVQLLVPGEIDPDRRQSLFTIGGQARRIRDMIGDVMLFARPPAPQFQRLDLAHLVADVARKMEEDAAAHRCRLETLALEPVFISGDRVQLSVVFSNLIRNALEAATGPGNVRLETALFPEGARVRVEDDGPGIPPSVREHLFDPFFSGRSAGRGLGFGLAKCHRILGLHGGQITLLDRGEAPGSCFEVRLPAL